MKSNHSTLITLAVMSLMMLSVPGLARPDGHAPISLMGDHTHKSQEWMFSYRYMLMNMDGVRVGSTPVSSAAVLGSYMMTPTKMTQKMHMLSAMYAPTNKLTLMVMGGYLSNRMEMLNRAGATLTSESEGISDTKVTALWNLKNSDGHRLLLNGGISVPTGSVSETDSSGNRLPYPMQIGSGTWELHPGITYTYFGDVWSIGSQFISKVRLGRNKHNYRLGSGFQGSVWAQINPTTPISFSSRLQYSREGQILGADADINQRKMMMPTADPSARGGERVDAFVGMNFYLPTLFGTKEIRGAAEYGLPVYQFVNGPQLEMDWMLTLGLQVSLF